MECIWSTETGLSPHPDHKRSRPPSSTVPDALSTVSARAENRIIHVRWYTRFTRVRSPSLSNQLRRTRTSSTVFPPVPTIVEDPKQSADSEERRVATIALHTKQEKTTKSSGRSGLSTGDTFIPCGLAISPCGLTPISAVTAATLEKSCKLTQMAPFH